MTNTNTHIPQLHSTFNGLVMNVLTTAMLVLAGVLTFAQFTNV